MEEKFSILLLTKCDYHYAGYYRFCIYCTTFYEQYIIYNELINRFNCSELEEIGRSKIRLKTFYSKLEYGPVKNYRFLVDKNNISSRCSEFLRGKYRLYINITVKYSNLGKVVSELLSISKKLNFVLLDLLDTFQSTKSPDFCYLPADVSKLVKYLTDNLK